MYNFIKIQYQLGRISNIDVMKFVPRWITDEQAEFIIK